MPGITKYITLEDAKKALAAGESEARKNNWNVAIAILDAGGHLMGTVPSTKRRGLSRVTWAMRLTPPRVPPAAHR